MELEDYVQSRETIYCMTETHKYNTQTQGQLTVTDSRLIYFQNIYFSDTRILDIDISRIEEIEFYKSPIQYLYLLIGVGLLFFTGIYWFVGPIFTELLETLPFRAFALTPLIFSVLCLYLALRRKETLIVRTPSNTHRFVGGDLEKFPHAIRGAAH